MATDFDFFDGNFDRRLEHLRGDTNGDIDRLENDMIQSNLKATKPATIGQSETADSAGRYTAQPSKYTADVAWFLSLSPEERLESCVQLVEMRENAKKAV